MDWPDSYDNFPKKENVNTVEIEIPYNLLQYLSSEESNIQSLCRICLSVQQNMTCLFSSSKPSLHDMLASISSTQAQVDDGLPSQICEKCQAEVIYCYNFKVKCDKSEYAIKSLLKGEFSSKDNESDQKEIKHENAEFSDKQKDYTEDTAVYSIETNEESAYALDATNKLESILSTKDEVDTHEDIQYLEALSEDLSDEETLCIVQKEERIKKNQNTPDMNLLIEIKKKTDSSEACAYCPKSFKNQRALGVHMRRRHGSEQNCRPCKQCKEVFNSDHDLHLHSALHTTGPNWKCNQCAKEFKTRSMLRRHVSRHMESKKFSCEHCAKTFVELYALRRHARVHTGEQREKKHVCHICDKRYAESGRLASHVASHSAARAWACECGRAFTSARLLASHRAVHSSRKPYACMYCDARFRHESTRNTHHRTHTGEKPYVCSACGKTFIQNSNLRLHMRTHTGERPYSCKLCARRFTSSSALKSHQRTHTNEKPCACRFCGKRFSATNLKAHLRLHSGDKPFECAVCPKKFVTATRLRDHCRIHTGEKPFECTTCHQSFTTKSHLRQHIKYHQNAQNAKKKPVAKRRENKVNEQLITPNTQEVPLEVSGELVVQDESIEKPEILVVDNSFQINGNICLEGVTYVNDDGTCGEDINLVSVNEGSLSSSAMIEGATVKLYQIDQSLVQIHSTDAQVTISKITSKMTTNF